ncbi:hypothetical protein D3C79_786280 [compost metagenome]
MIGCRFTPAFVSLFWYYPRHAQSSFLTRREAGYRIAPILHRRTLQRGALRPRPHRRHHGRHHRHSARHGAGHRQRGAAPARPLHRHHRRHRHRRDGGLALLDFWPHCRLRGDPLSGGPAIRGGGPLDGNPYLRLLPSGHGDGTPRPSHRIHSALGNAWLHRRHRHRDRHLADQGLLRPARSRDAGNLCRQGAGAGPCPAQLAVG